MQREAVATTIQNTVFRLEALGAELAGLGWPSRLVSQPARLPRLHVVNPEPGAAALSEDVYCAARVDELVFWWSWAEPIAAEPADAAAIIVRVLRPAAG
jgi:hypothetical protein